ncbi:MAG: restriction endonuclease [Planctomycetota bacterium]
MIALPLITAKTVNSRIKQRLADQIAGVSADITEEQLDQLTNNLIAPFLSRNEVPVGTIPPANGFVVRRLKSLDQAADVLIEPNELQMLQELLARERVTLWATASDAHVVLTAVSLKNDYALFKQRIEQLVSDRMSVLAAYASLVSADIAFLPFLQHMLAEQGLPEDPSSLLTALDKVRRQLQLHGFAKELQQRRHGSLSLTLQMVDAMDPYNFELLLGMMYESRGYRVVETPKSGDQGADVLLERAGERTVVQAKLYSGYIGNKAVQEAIAARSHFRCHAAKVVTNNFFTPSARQLAESSDVQLVGRDELAQMIAEFNRNPKDYARLAALLEGGTWEGARGNQ